MMRFENREVTRIESLPAAWVCDYCGKEDAPYAIMWGFPPPRWIHMKWGSDPLYSPESDMCDECASSRGIIPPMAASDG